MEREWPETQEPVWLHGVGDMDAGTVWAWGPRTRHQPEPLCCRAVSGVDSESDVVHLQAHALGGGKQGWGAAEPVVPEGTGPAARLGVRMWSLVLGAWPCTATARVMMWPDFKHACFLVGEK